MLVVYVMFVVSSVTSGAQTRRERDERRVGRFVVETAEIESDDEPFPAAFLAALRRLVPCDDVAFCETDRRPNACSRGVVPVWRGPDQELTP